MPRRSPLPPQLGAAFARSAALDVGVSRSRLTASDLGTPFRGARIVVSKAPVEFDNRDERRAFEHRAFVQRCRAYASIGHPFFAFYGVTAARLYGIPIPHRYRFDRPLDVSVPLGVAVPRRDGVAGFRATIRVRRSISGVPVPDPETVWMQLAPQLTIDELVVAGDFLVKRKQPLSSLDGIETFVMNSAGTRGIRRARTAFGDIRSGTDSPRESLLRLVIVRAGLPEPVVGHAIHDDDGFFLGTPDLAYVAEKIAIEYQGKHHQTDDRTYEDDIVRRQQFADAGWHVILVTAAHSDQYTLWRIRQALADRASRAH
jgi:hypothetical protein